MKPVRESRWRLRKPDPAVLAILVDQGGIEPLAAKLLVNRGVSDIASAQDFLSPQLAQLHDPFLLKGMEEAVARLITALERKERVCVYGDYDVDGITSVTLLIDFLQAAGYDTTYYIPLRLEEGYGLSGEGIDHALSQGAALVVTVDCGITAIAEAEYAASSGLDLIITDHHLPGETLPACLAVVNPLQPGCRFPFKALAGVGVAFNLVVALRSRLRSAGLFAGRDEPNLKESLDLVALGTIADVVPLVDENRIIVTYGLRQLTNSSRIGIAALKKVAGVEKEVGCGAVGFRLAPRLNAAGRLDAAAPGVELLLSADRCHADLIAAELDEGNSERQAIEQQILREAVEMVQRRGFQEQKSIVLASDGWHAGVIGIVASRLVELYHRPTILIALKDGMGRGSGRSIHNFHLHDALHSCSGHLAGFGGHRHAAGLRIDASMVEPFTALFEDTAAAILTPEDLLPEITIDAELLPEDLTLEVSRSVALLSPFGPGNPEPVFLLRNARVIDRRILKDKHLKLRLGCGGKVIEAIGFDMAGRTAVEKVDIAFSLQTNVWKGRESLQLKLRDLRPVTAKSLGAGADPEEIVVASGGFSAAG